MGRRYYCVFVGDVIKLFADFETALMHLNLVNEEDAWECKPKFTIYIFRQPKVGLIHEDRKSSSFVILVQDNESKM